MVCVTVAAMGLAGCGGGGNASGAQTRTVQVDHKYDQFATALLAYFPRTVDVRPGDTVRFKQTWTGEPHSVTMGAIVDRDIAPIANLLDGIAAGTTKPPDDCPPEAAPFCGGPGGEPSFFGDTDVNQNAAQPCYLTTGSPPADPTQPCAKHAQPAFNGRQSFYSSGFIPYQGLNGNTFEVKLAADTKPGKYRYFCNVHNVPMNGVINVKAKGAAIASQGEVDRQAQREIDKAVEPAVKLVDKIKAGKGEYPGNLAGAGKDLELSINEFFPKTITTKVNEKVTWTMVNHHTISFNAPKYLPIVNLAKNGAVSFNKKLDETGGWTMPLAGGSDNGPPTPARNIDVGKWDGKGFHSTGTNLNTGDTFSVTFTKPGTYLYACVVHPPMVAKVVVK
jgi:plastocyanin